jgi:hypothetical protein
MYENSIMKSTVKRRGRERKKRGRKEVKKE